MSKIEESIDIELPVRVIYNQWTQFEEFPSFMEGVEEVQQLDDQRLHWRASIAGQEREWDAKVIEQVPDQRIAWASVDGATNAGAVSFEPVGEGSTRVRLELDFEPEGFVEAAGDTLGFVRRRAAGDLENFKEFIEARGRETGAWRGEV